MSRIFPRAILFSAFIALLVLIIAFPDSRLVPSAEALTNPCALDSTNLIVNGSMIAAHSNDVLALNWNSFVLSGSPVYQHVDNEQIDPNGSQYIWADISAFDAGIYQTVNGLVPGSYYHFWWGYALAAKDPGGGGSVRTNLIGREVGIDLTGGTNPNSPNVGWGVIFWNGQAALNIRELSRTFSAETSRATFFLRNINTDTTGRNKVWIDSICMEPTATPVVSPKSFLPFVFFGPQKGDESSSGSRPRP
jgi:hypothetical protein